MPNDNQGNYYPPPTSVPAQASGEVVEEVIEEQPSQESKWGWVGSPNTPDAKKHDDGISDLFEVDNDPDTADLLTVDVDEDIIDGPLDDLVDVTEDDIMGDELGQTDLDYKPEPPRQRPAPRFRRVVRRPYTPPTRAGGVGG